MFVSLAFVVVIVFGMDMNATVRDDDMKMPLNRIIIIIIILQWNNGPWCRSSPWRRGAIFGWGNRGVLDNMISSFFNRSIVCFRYIDEDWILTNAGNVCNAVDLYNLGILDQLHLCIGNGTTSCAVCYICRLDLEIWKDIHPFYDVTKRG